MKMKKSKGILVSALLFSVLLMMAGATGIAAWAAEPAKTSQSDLQRLEGRWVRPDGGYILELKDIKKDGSMTAAYFNPRSIRVFRAEAAKKNGTIALFVELRDINYPGSTYNLQYDSAADRLKGTYFQAVERRMFDVEFVRAR